MGSFFLPNILSLTSQRQHGAIMFGNHSHAACSLMRLFCYVYKLAFLPTRSKNHQSRLFYISSLLHPLYPLYNLSKSLAMYLTTTLFSALTLSLTTSSSLLPADAHKRATDYSGQETQLTFFGYPDNCDSTGCYYSETAYQCSNPDGSSRNGAQGDGSYNNPLSGLPAGRQLPAMRNYLYCVFAEVRDFGWPVRQL